MIDKFKFGVVTMFVTSSVAFSQSMEEGKKMFYYGKFLSAKQIFEKNNSPESVYWLGQTLLREKASKSEVRTLYANALQLNPKSELLQVGISHIDVLEGKAKEAKAVQSNILSKTKDIEIYNAVARAQLSTNNENINFVIEQLKKASEFNKKKNPETPILLAQAYLRNSNTSDATYALITALEFDPNNAYALSTRAKMYNFKADATNEGRYIDFMNQAIMKDKNFAPAYYDLFYLYYSKDKNRALNYFNTYKQLADKTPELEYINANVNYNVGNHQQAIDESLKVIARDAEKTDARYYKVLAHSYLDTQNLTEASKYLNLYLSKVNKDDVNYGDYLEASKIAFQLNDENNAKNMLNSALEITQNNGERFNVAQVAISIYKEKFETNKADVNLANNYRIELANWYEINYKNHHNPTNVDLYNFGIENFYIKNWEKTQEAFSLYSEKYPTQIQGFYFTAIANYKSNLNNKDKAIEYFNKAVQSGISAPVDNKYFLNQSLLALAEYSRESGDIAKTKEFANQILSYDSENPQAKALLQL